MSCGDHAGSRDKSREHTKTAGKVSVAVLLQHILMLNNIVQHELIDEQHRVEETKETKFYNKVILFSFHVP